ncbi:ABC transporter ATP-binding protein/permease [Rhodoferax sp. TS-BS-61-7]|uniref:ABC transporter ATP-binding protein/permease n=1 Tax=Rhodoferax sp. TS-BS-61-7 TaxID=2094194 RepID=UPI000CF660B9|nr:ABC transporter ATP-binding protein/permease [Rhodoferax sp. TS-BS-61-7]PQA77850.1 ABC transporter ATP-binding protein [Rhodoferax sp. TS-BS-61-7]
MAFVATAGDKLRAFGQFARRVWALTQPYFHSEDKWKARGMLAAIVALNLGLVYMAVLFNDWNKLFYDALQEKNAGVFWAQLGRFTYLAFAFIVIAVYKFYLTQLLEMRWRAWMTAHYLQRWLSGQAFYRLELARFTHTAHSDANPDNPDQRIQEDINQFTSYTISLTMGLLNAVVTLASFIGILWSLSGGFAFNVAGHDYNIPGFMVWMAVLYCAAGSIITHYIGRKQIPLNFAQQRVEADFRHTMIRVREYSESIALDRGETVARRQLGDRFDKVLGNYLALIKAQKSLIWFTSFFGQAAVVFPFVVAAPRFFSGAIQLGELMQISSAFGQVQGALSWFVDNYGSLATWRATTDRLTSFEASFRALAPVDIAQAAPETIASPDTLIGSDVSVALPNGTVLLAPTQLQAQPGDRILLQGPSGSGKSSLFRTLAGIWPFASGAVHLPTDTMFIPQRPYFPNGPLREALAYPQAPTTYTDAQLQQALRDALLPGLVDDLDRVDAWSQKLSGGEQQRLAIARVLLKQPQWIFADEATSALDEAAEHTLYQRLSDLVAQRGGGLVSIAHRPAVAAFHSRQWVLTPRQGEGALFTLSEKRT